MGKRPGMGGKFGAACESGAVGSHAGSARADSLGERRGDHVRRSLEVVYECLRLADVTMADVGCVLVVGGAGRPPEVAEVLSAELARPVLMAPDPERTIAEGAAILAHRAVVAAAAEVLMQEHRPPGEGRMRRRLVRAAVTATIATAGALLAATAVAGDDSGGPATSGGPEVVVQPYS